MKKKETHFKRVLSVVLAAILIAQTAWVPAENNAKVSTAASNEVVYVSDDTGSDENAGTEAEPLKTLEKAFSVVANGGTIQIVGTYDEATSWSPHGKTITITGDTLKFTSDRVTMGGLGDVLTFENITLSLYELGQRMFANGCKLTIGEGVVTINEPQLYGGPIRGELNGDTNLEVYSGTWSQIYGGGNDNSSTQPKVKGNTHVIVGGNVNQGIDLSDHTLRYAIYGGGNGSIVTGSTNVTVKGQACARYVYGGGKFSDHGEPSVDGGTNVVITENAQIIGVNGGSYFGDKKTDYTTTLNTNVLMTGGTVEQVFGGNTKANLTGNVDVRILGGTVTRRIYGGNYNETETLSTTLATNYAVNGNIKLAIGGEAQITFTGDSDQGIFARSRNNPKSDSESATLIFDDEQAYNAYKDRIGAHDSGASSVMDDITAADTIHYFTYTANDETNTITATCSICGTEHTATATLSALQDTPMVCTGKAVEGAKLEYSDNWEAFPLEIRYEDNVKDGTATATCTKNGASVSVNFELESTVLSGKKISILGDEISTYIGVSNNANMNKTIGTNDYTYSTGATSGVSAQSLTYWGNLIEKYGMELCVNNSTSGGKVAADVGTDGVRPSGITRSTELHNNDGQEPDIIVVALGRNDLDDNDSTSFKDAYKEMLDNILERYVKAEVFCFTLMAGKDYQTYETRVTDYNSKIKDIVSEYNDRVTLVDMYTESGIAWNTLSQYTYDDAKANPSKAGMDMMAKVLERALLDVHEPASLPNTPDTYFDLEIDLENNEAQNAGTSDADISNVGKGSYTIKEVVYNGQTCKVPVFSVEKDTSSNSYLEVTFKDLESTKEAMGNWILKDGITFETFLYVENQPGEWCGIMSHAKTGGISLYALPDNAGNSNFFIGTNDGKSGTGNWKTTDSAGNNHYRYAANYSTAADYTEIKSYQLNTGTFVHVVGTYDSATNMMALYHDGELLGTGSYGDGEFRADGITTNFNHLGIGTNLGALGESLDDCTSYAIADARIYSGGLTAAQVKQEYKNRWNEVLKTSNGPDVYFDLDFQDTDNDGVKEYVNAGTNEDRAEITSVGEGTITTMEVTQNGQIYEVPVYKAEKTTSSSTKSYLGVTFLDITEADDPADAMKDWIFDNGITYECFIYVDTVPSDKTVGFMTNLWSGGIGLYSKTVGLNFQMGSTATKTGAHPFNGTYLCAFPYTSSTSVGDGVVSKLVQAQNKQMLSEKQLTHVVGTYDSKTNVMSVYKDGQLVGQGTYSKGGKDEYEPGKSLPGQLGLGCNIAYVATNEWLSQYTQYAIADARVYSSALTAEQVVEQYNNRWDEVKSHITVSQLDDLSEYADVTTGNSQELDGLPTYYSGGKEFGVYEGSNTGDRAAANDEDYTLYAFSNSTNSAYVSYLKALEKAGWEQYSNNIIDDNNLFATYTMDDDNDGNADRSVYVYYIADKESTYIVASQTVNLENKAEEYETVCKPLFTELKTLSSSQCEIVRLSDGRFIVIDSGMEETNHYQAKNIYKTLKKQNVLNKITVAAWIVTHPHTDHMNACMDFLKLYGNDQVEIEEIIFNFPNETDRVAADSEYQPTTTNKFFDAIDVAMKKWPNMKIITCHTGQEYQIADAKIEILHTIEDYFPKKIYEVNDKLNDSSVVFRIEIAGQSIMILGDAGSSASNDVITMWDDYLKSDFVQMSHHGMDGGTVALYEHIDPTVVTIPATRSLWTTTNTNYIGQYDPTKWVFDNTSGNIKEVCIAGLGTHTFTLPYTPQGDNATILGVGHNGYDLEEGPKVIADIPEPYMDLTFDGTSIKDGSTKANNTLEMAGGSVGENTVYYNGEPYTVTSYRGEKTTDYNYIKVTMNDISATDATGITGFITDKDGFSMEMFFALDEEITSIGGVMAGCNGGGVAMYARKPGIIGWQMGSENSSGTNTYIYGADPNAQNKYNLPVGNTVIHVVVTYDSTTGKMSLYQNGSLLNQKDYDATFRVPNSDNMAYNVMGIGANIGSIKEALSASTGYTVINSRIYDESLNAEQVAASYWNCISELTGEEVNAIYERKTVAYTRDEANKFLSKGTYPRKEGYLFGGWYKTTNIPEIDVTNYETSANEALKYVIRDEVPDTLDTVYALFVPEDVMTVKAQVSANLIDDVDTNNDKGSIRFVTTVDSLLYQQAGFTVNYVNSSGTPKNITSVSNKVYDTLHAVDASGNGDIENKLTYLPTQFCSVSKYFKACTVINLSAEKFDREFTVTPFWVTLDGSYVYGEPVIKSISQYPSMLK